MVLLLSCWPPRRNTIFTWPAFFIHRIHCHYLNAALFNKITQMVNDSKILIIVAIWILCWKTKKRHPRMTIDTHVHLLSQTVTIMFDIFSFHRICQEELKNFYIPLSFSFLWFNHPTALGNFLSIRIIACETSDVDVFSSCIACAFAYFKLLSTVS